MIYGTPEPPLLPGTRFARATPALDPARPGGARPGELWHTARHVLVRPMPPRVA